MKERWVGTGWRALQGITGLTQLSLKTITRH